ncbi:hypothetical protein TNCV_78951 [Trichonephila clavipes]|nr:hypothetical protein TNCV_78951 [Trichonephila clavipes]
MRIERFLVAITLVISGRLKSRREYLTEKDPVCPVSMFDFCFPWRRWRYIYGKNKIRWLRRIKDNHIWAIGRMKLRRIRACRRIWNMVIWPFT